MANAEVRGMGVVFPYSKIIQVNERKRKEKLEKALSVWSTDVDSQAAAIRRLIVSHNCPQCF